MTDKIKEKDEIIEKLNLRIEELEKILRLYRIRESDFYECKKHFDGDVCDCWCLSDSEI